MPTFLGAHTLPPEYRDDADGYVDLVVEEMIPAVAAVRRVPLCEGRPPALHRRLLRGARLRRGPILPYPQGRSGRGHAAQSSCGPVQPAGRRGDGCGAGRDLRRPLGRERPDEIATLAAPDTIAVPLPAANVNLGHTTFAPGRASSMRARPLLWPRISIPAPHRATPSRWSWPWPRATCACCRRGALRGHGQRRHAIGLGAQVGSLDVGKQADLLILKEADYRTGPTLRRQPRGDGDRAARWWHDEQGHSAG
ncbi:MAG: hypothetical protein R2851_26525 [Caldilineaceae bacterium]